MIVPVLLLLALLTSPTSAIAQVSQDAGPQPPIVLEWADSLVGTSPSGNMQREFLGHVRFRQGNVTVTCDRAVHDATSNAAEMFGNVVVTQDSLVMRAPYALYDGRSYTATANRGIVVLDGRRRLEALQGTYSTRSHIAEFDGKVVVRDDTITVWSDRAVYERDTKVSIATGTVLLVDSIRKVILQGDTLYHSPLNEFSRAIGNAAMWQWDTDTISADSIRIDTLVVRADTLEAFQGTQRSYAAQGNVDLVRDGIAARADSLNYSDISGLFALFGSPILWADSTQLLADTIEIDAPGRRLNTIQGISQAMMMSKTDTTFQDRYDQVVGQTITIYVTQDTIRSLIAVTDAQSITFRSENGVGDGLAKFACDTIKAQFVNGQPEDIFWLGGVQGEHHPEPVVAGRAGDYRLPGFDWRTDRPALSVPPAPYQERVPREARLPRATREVSATTEKKK